MISVILVSSLDSINKSSVYMWAKKVQIRGAGAGPAGTAAAGPMLEAKRMNLIKGRLQKF